jgi:dihydroneopterin aldolase
MSSTSKVQPLRIADAARGIRHVFIRNLEVLAHIGVYGHEQGKLQPVRINVDLAVEDVIAVEDKLEKVVDYASIEQRIRAIIAHGHINLAETLAERIAQTSFDDARVKSARVRVEKLHALPGAESAGVEIERTRP